MPPRTDPASISSIRPFTDFLLDLDKGRVLSELSARLTEVSGAVIATGKKGSVTLKVTVDPRPDGETVDVTAATTSVVPKPDHAGVFFVTEDHQLTRDDPAYAEPLLTRDEIEKGQF